MVVMDETRKINMTQMCWLAVLAVGGSVTALIVDESVLLINQFKFEERRYFWFWVLSSMLFAACAVTCIQFVSAQAAGSGIPQMRAIMAGVTLENMLSVRTYIGKCLGMIFMLASGLSLGKEGPFVHIAGCIAESLPYEDKKINKTLRHQFLTAAVAVGVSATFGAPIGGVLFAIEVSTSSFTVSNLWKSFFCSTISVLCFKAFGSLGTATFTADASYFYQGDKSLGINIEQPLFVILGVLCGCLGTLYIAYQKNLNAWKKRMAAKYPRTFGNNYVYTLTVTFLLSSIIQHTRIMQTGDKSVIGATIDIDQTLARLELTEETADKRLAEQFSFGWDVMESDSKWILYDGYLIMFIVQKFIFTGLTLSCAVPGGIFTPTFAIGAVVGQLYVSTVRKILLFFGIYNYIEFRGVYSIIGAAAMTASVTRTVSVAMIVLELNGHLSHAVPCMVCVLSSYFISEFLRPMSFFEMLTITTGLDQKVAQKGNIIIKDMLELMPHYKDLDRKYLSLNESTELDMIDIVDKHGHLDHSRSAHLAEEKEEAISGVFKQRYVPIVDNHKWRNLLFMVKIEELQRYCELHFNYGFGRENQAVRDMRANRTCKCIILSMRQVAPPILFYEAPMSYMTENKASKFYDGVPPPEDQIQVQDPAHDHDEMSQKVINYCVVQPRYEKKITPNQFNFGQAQGQDDDEPELTRPIVGARLVGIIPCSDARGYGILIKDFREAEAKQKKIKEQELKVINNDDNYHKVRDEQKMSERGRIESERRRGVLDAKESGLQEREQQIQALIEQMFQKEQQLRAMVAQTKTNASKMRSGTPSASRSERSKQE